MAIARRGANEDGPGVERATLGCFTPPCGGAAGYGGYRCLPPRSGPSGTMHT